jgi:transcriptional regulator with XRE-family HTH domain
MLTFVPERANPGQYEQAASQFLRALRGHRSQRAVAKRLGYRGNPITDWERGTRHPTAVEALRLARLLGKDVPGAFATFHPVPLPERTAQGYDVAAWLDAVRGSAPLVDLARRAGVSRFAMGRWLHGDARPRLPDFFRVLDAATGRLPDWVACFVPIEEVPSLRRRYQAADAARRAAYQAPWTEAVLRVLETPAYAALDRHDDAWIARRLGVAPDEVKTSLALLRSAGAIRRRGRRYHVAEDDFAVDTRGERSRVGVLLAHWAEVARSRVDARGPEALFAYNVCAVSRTDQARIRELLRGAYREVRSIVASSRPSERVVLLNLHWVGLEAEE